MSTITGIDETIRALRNVEDGLKKKAHNKAMGGVGAMAKVEVKQNIPKLTGSLYRSIGRKTKRKGGIALYTIIGVRAQYQDPKTGKIPNKYATKVEFGTSDEKAHKFVRKSERPILRRSTLIFKESYVAEIRKHLKA